MIVSADGSGDFTTVQDAIDAIPADNTKPMRIHIKNGIYKEKIRLEKPYVTLVGEDKDRTIITYDDHANKLFPNGEPYGTFNSYTILFGAHDITAQNLSFVNSAGKAGRVGQALAAYVDGDRTSFTTVVFSDIKTLYLRGHYRKSRSKAQVSAVRENQRIEGKFVNIMRIAILKGMLILSLAQLPPCSIDVKFFH